MVSLELTSLIMVNILSNICYSILVPFLPIEFAHYGIHVSTYGYIFAMYAFAVMVGSPIVGKALTVYGRKLILILGLSWMGVSLLGFGLINCLKSKNMMVTVALILRTTQGLSSGLIQTTSYAIVAVTFPEKQQKYLGILEASMGFGLVIGPVIGSTLYTILGFQGTFFLVGTVFIISAITLVFIIPKTVDKTDEAVPLTNQATSEKLEDELETPQLPQTHHISYKDVIWQRIFLCTAFSAFFAYFSYSFMEPVLAIRLMEFNISEFWVGIFFCINAVAYVMGSLCISSFTDRFDNKILIVFGLFAGGLSEFFIGPSPFLPDKLWIMGFGQFVLGLFTIFFLVTCLPEMIEDVVRYHPEFPFEASDMSAGVFNSMLGFGQMLSPLYGSYMTEAFGFRFWADSVGYLLIGYSILYFFLWVGLTYAKTGRESFRSPERNKEILRRESVIEAFGDKWVLRRKGTSLTLDFKTPKKTINPNHQIPK